MQGGSRRPAMRYARRPDTEEEEQLPRPPSSDTKSEDETDSKPLVAVEPEFASRLVTADPTSTSTASSSGRGSLEATLQQLAIGTQAAAAAAVAAIGGPAMAVAAVAAVALAGLGLGLGLMLRRKSAGRGSSSRRRDRSAKASSSRGQNGRTKQNSSGAGVDASSVSEAADAGHTAMANGTAHAAGGKANKGKLQRKETPQPGPLSKLKATSNCVPLADGRECVVRRKIAADNSCLFNAVGYCMHKSHNKAPFLRNVVAREVAGDPQSYTAAFLGSSNAAYCAWIVNPMNWGGGIELSILVKHYRREIAAWNIESARAHVFGEDAGFKKQVMVIYNGNHYDALAISKGPRASPEDDETEFNPRTKRGKMILAAAKKLVELNHKGSKFVSASPKSSAPVLRCTEDGCGAKLASQQEAMAHASATGHAKFEEAKS